MESEPCAFCDNKAIYQCDGILAWLSDDGKRFSSKCVNFTCDLNLCEDHALQEASLHYALESGHQFDSLDYCPNCVKEGKTFGNTEPVFVLSVEAGKALQRRRSFVINLRPYRNLAREMLT